MSKSKEGRPEEFYKSMIRNLKKENSQLRKKLQKLENQLGPKEPRERIKKESEFKLPECPKCNKHTIEEMEFVGRIFDVCQSCSYRSKARKAFKKKR